MKKLILAMVVLITLSLPLGLDAKTKRSAIARNDFKREHPCPATGKTTGACPGYIIDHIVPLKRGGADKPENMQWQTKKEAKEKDKWE